MVSLCRRGVEAVVLAAGCLLTAAPAQVPAHATWLNPTTVQRYPLVLQDGDDVHVFALGYGTLLRARSPDGGRTWPTLEAPLGAYQGDLAFAATIASPGTVLALGNDQYTGPVYWRSADRGATWSATAPLFTVTGVQGVGSVALLADGNDVVAVWLRGSSGDLYCRRSLDGGVTWQPTQALLGASGTNGSGFLNCFRTGNVLDVLWQYNAAGTLRQRSTDGGATWLAAPTSVSAQALQTATSDGTNMLVRLTNHSLLHSANGGASWQVRTIPGMSYPREMAQEGPLMAVVGTTGFPGLGATTYVVSVSSDGGATWLPSPLLLPSPVSYPTRVDVDGGVVYVHFAGYDPLALVVTRDAGTSWQLVGGPVSGGFATGPGRNLHLVQTYVPPTTYGNFHIYVGLGSTPLGSGTVGTGGITPRLRGQGLPFQGAMTTLQVGDAVGGSLAALAVSFAPPLAVPLGSAIVWPTTAPIVFPFLTGGSAGVPGSGAFGLPIAVPVNPALVGASFTSQSLVIDAANPDGFAVSNALETWLR